MDGLVRSRGCLDLLANTNADSTADRDETATTVGTLVLVAGVVVGYGLFELYAGFSAATLVPCVVLVVALYTAAVVRAERRK